MTTAFSSSEPLLSVAQVARHFSISRASVRRWINEGRLPSLKIGGSIRVSVEALQQFIERNQREREAQQV